MCSRVATSRDKHVLWLVEEEADLVRSRPRWQPATPAGSARFTPTAPATHAIGSMTCNSSAICNAIPRATGLGGTVKRSLAVFFSSAWPAEAAQTVPPSVFVPSGIADGRTLTKTLSARSPSAFPAAASPGPSARGVFIERHALYSAGRRVTGNTGPTLVTDGKCEFEDLEM